MAAGSHGWVLPEWPSLSRRPLILGLPYGTAACLIMFAILIGVAMKLVGAAIAMLVPLWLIAAAISYYDPWNWEIMVAAARLPRVLKAC